MRFCKINAFSIVSLALILSACTTSIRGNRSTASSTTDDPVIPGKLWVPNISGSISTLVANDDTLYVGGDFWYLGPNTPGSAILDSSTQTFSENNFSDTIKTDGSEVYTTISDGNGGYYMGGIFTYVNGETTGGLVHILSDGTLDSTFHNNAGAVAASVRTLLLHNGILYVGGWFNAIGGATRNYLASLDATTGIATTWDPDADSEVVTLATDGTYIYAGGSFTNFKSTTVPVARNFVARIPLANDGTPEATWDPDADNNVNVVALKGTKVYIGGQFDTVNGAARRSVAEVSTTSDVPTAWSPSPNIGGDVKSLAVNNAGDTVYVGGSFTTIGGQGRNHVAALSAATGLATTWNPNPDGFYIQAVAVSADDSKVYVGGAANMRNIGGQARSCFAEISATTGLATSWELHGSELVDQILVDGTDIIISGYFNSMGGKLRNRIGALDIATGEATSWNPNSDGLVNSLILYRDKVLAGGSFTTIGGQSRNNLAEIDSAGAATSWDPNVDNMVRAMALYEDTVYIGGWFSTVGATGRNKLAAFDMANSGSLTSWDPDCNGFVYSLAVDSSKVYIGGSLITIGGVARTGAAAVSSTGVGAIDTLWIPNPNSPVNTFLLSGTKVYVGGSFTTIGGGAHTYVAELNNTTGTATTWSPTLDNSVFELALSGSTLYAGGAFTTINATTRNYAAAFNTTTGALDTNFNPNFGSDVYSIVTTDSAVYTGGNYLNRGLEANSSLTGFDLTTGDPL